MDKEVEDVLSGESDDEDDNEVSVLNRHDEDERPMSSSSEDSISGELPRGHKRKSGDIEEDLDVSHFNSSLVDERWNENVIIQMKFCQRQDTDLNVLE